jgi:cytochrome c5
MSPTHLIGLFLFVASITTPALAWAQASTAVPATLPEGNGRDLVTTLCAGCHSVHVATGKRGTRAEWRTTIDAMIARGARVTAEEAATIAAYLGEHFGPAVPSPASPGASFPDGPGRDVLVGKCFQCHTQGMWKDLRQDRRRWEAVLYRMVGRGALWTEGEMAAMAEYLARVYGASPARSAR